MRAPLLCVRQSNPREQKSLNTVSQYNTPFLMLPLIDICYELKCVQSEKLVKWAVPSSFTIWLGYVSVWNTRINYRTQKKRSIPSIDSSSIIVIRLPLISEYMVGATLQAYLLYLLPGWGCHVLGGTQLTHLESTKHHNSINLRSP